MTMRGNIRSILANTATPLGTANVFYVSSVTGSSGNTGTTPSDPKATIAQALALCTADAGDVIYLLPGHAETLGTGSTAISVAGVQIIGIGRGSKRPTLTYSDTTSVITCSAANVLLNNIVILAGVDEVVKAFNVTAAGVTIDAVDVVETASKQFIQFLLTSAAGDDLTIQNCKHHQATAASADQVWIDLVCADRALIQDNIFHLTLKNASGCITLKSTTTAPVGITVRRNVIVQLGGTTQVAAISFVSSTSGYVSDNRVAANVTTLAGTVALASCYGANNLVSHTVNKSGILDPVADT